MKMQTGVCPQCGRAFSYYPSRMRSGVKTHCSRACLHAASRLTTACPECGKVFEYDRSWPRKYCSRACAAKNTVVTNLGVKPLSPKDCEVCGRPIVKKVRAAGDRFCSRKCFGEWVSRTNVGENHPLWGGGYGDYYYGSNWQQQRRNARRRDNYTCQRCGKTEEMLGKALDVHHITPFRTFGLNRYKEANRLSNLVSLCNSCHKYVEHHGWTTPAVEDLG